MTDIDDYARLFLNDTPLIDTRAPVEFSKGSFPTAVNLPLMTDDERAAVGSCYKQQGPDAAVALGHELVSGETKNARVDAWTNFAREHPEGALFCFRGGMRSAISQAWLGEAGIDYPRVKGGYKAMRRWLLEEVDTLCRTRDFLVLGGKTGCAKTRLINTGAQGKPLAGSIDLEGLANHRGSSFGRRAGGQPSQIDFETRLGSALLKVSHQWSGPIIAEDESRLIGRCSLPVSLQEALQCAPLVLLETSLEARVSHSFENYILANLTELTTLYSDEATAFEQFAQDLLDALDRIRKRLGGKRHAELRQIMEDAICQHRRGHPEGHRHWIEPLLRDYYDPMYAYQVKSRSDRIVFRGTPDAVIEYLNSPVADRLPR